MSLAGGLDQVRVGQGDRAQDHPAHAAGQPIVDRRHGADAAAQLHGDIKGRQNAGHGGGVHRLSFEGAIKINQVNPFTAGVPERLRLRRRVVGKHRRLVHVALIQAHAIAVLEVDGGKKDHAGHAPFIIPRRSRKKIEPQRR